MSGEDEYTNAAREGHRAVGRYVIEFSQLFFRMRTVIEHRLNTDPPQLGMLVMGEATAQPIANVFFSMCRLVGNLDSDEEAIARALSNAVAEAIKTRNDVAHGDWFVGWGAIDGPPEPPTLQRTKPQRKDGALVQYVWNIEDLDQMADDLLDLTGLVSAFGNLCVGLHPRQQEEEIRVRDILILQDGKVLREGPRA
ncbi:MAG TPA: hypothetical protein VF533_24305 [Solirubrobacteraceae bacterium]